jgi:hypothetical protein
MKLPFDPNAYGIAVAELLSDSVIPPLGPGKPNQAMRGKLAELTAEKLAGNQKIIDLRAAQACIAGLWLWHNFLDESHGISQEIETAEGSFWHGIMHRREPDYGNAKYWFRRVGAHPVIGQLAEQAPSLGYKFTDSYAFVDFAERACGKGGDQEELATQVQQLEWQFLFDHCYRAACG